VVSVTTNFAVTTAEETTQLMKSKCHIIVNRLSWPEHWAEKLKRTLSALSLLRQEVVWQACGLLAENISRQFSYSVWERKIW
jgi:hypothetical protein